MKKVAYLRDRIRKVRSGLGTVAHLLSFLLIAMGTGVAQNAPLDQEIWKQSQIFNPKASFDTTPVMVKVYR
jgi:hypothetical protein